MNEMVRALSPFRNQYISSLPPRPPPSPLTLLCVHIEGMCSPLLTLFCVDVASM